MKHAFSSFLESDPRRLHFAAHSHHPWPDVTYAAHRLAWEDAARLMDDKWDHVFGEVFPAARALIARTLNLSHPETLVFAPNTHELILRIASCLDGRFRILTTDAEFHSLSRQVARWEEDGMVEVTRVAAQPFATFPDRLVGSFSDHDLVFFSHVHFDSGYVVPDVAEVATAFPEPALVVIDGYHGFMAVPTDWAGAEGRAFYLAGGYKYAMAGEGACFLHVPPAAPARPPNTGWWAGFESLPEPQGRVEYGSGGQRFAGATIDPSGVYRLHAVLEWLEREGVTVQTIHDHVTSLQSHLLDALADTLRSSLLPPPGTHDRGHFLTFRRDDAGEIYGRLHARGVITDHRGDRWRIGFGLYHDIGDVETLAEHITAEIGGD